MPAIVPPTWEALVQVAASAVLIYAALVVMLRVSGKRTLAKFNAFDFIVTVALGSMVANTILNDETTVVEGAVGIAVLLAAQAAVSFSVTRWSRLQDIVKSQPVLLWYRGTFREAAMRRERVATNEIRLAVRAAGYAELEDVLAVVLETDGTMSVIGVDGQDRSGDALVNVRMEGDA